MERLDNLDLSIRERGGEGGGSRMDKPYSTTYIHRGSISRGIFLLTLHAELK
jgi:hypothetical protein